MRDERGEGRERGEKREEREGRRGIREKFVCLINHKKRKVFVLN